MLALGKSCQLSFNGQLAFWLLWLLDLFMTGD